MIFFGLPGSHLLPTMWTAILVGLLIDLIWGEPPSYFHPVVWMGHYLKWSGDLFAPLIRSASFATNLLTFFKGCFFWILGAVPFLVLAIINQYFLNAMPWYVSGLILGVLLKPFFSWKMLREEVSQVKLSLNRSLYEGKNQLSRLVSRPTERLTESEISEAAIETLAENYNDSVVAPLFWFLLGGLPGAVLYRFANTADAMWGYPAFRGSRYWQFAGKWAARTDDVLSYVLARISSVLIIGFHFFKNGKQLKQEAAKTPSPNSGWPMAATALSLNLRLGKQGVYLLNPSGKSPQVEDIPKAIRLIASRHYFLVTFIFFLLLQALTFPNVWDFFSGFTSLSTLCDKRFNIR